MNYYSHHIGDFDRATRHLTRVERSIYLDLMFVYYDTEKPLTLDQPSLCRKVIARGPEEIAAVGAVLAEFFHETPSGWYHDRCEEELETFRKSTSQKSVAGKASAAAKAARRQQAINGDSTRVERLFNGTSTNQEPVTNNQEPLTKESTQLPDAVAPSVAVERRADIVEAIEHVDHPPAILAKRVSQPRGNAGTEVREVFVYWQQARNHPQAKLDAKREKAIKARLKDGYTVGELCQAVDGCSASAYHMGQNQNQAVYDDIELICRDASKVDGFIKQSQAQPGVNPGLQRQAQILKDWI